MPADHVTILLVLGLVTGVLGGLLGIGGSVVMIPVLVVVLGKPMHLAQAAAMCVNGLIAIPAVRQHVAARAVRLDVFRRMLPVGLVAIVVGVEVANRIPGDLLRKIFGVFLIYVVIVNVRKVIARAAEPEAHEQRPGWPFAGSVGGIMGFAAGVLGIGGGAIGVPLMQRICNLPIRQCIATSSAVMCVTAWLGAARKNLALADLGLDWHDSLLIAACLAPTAIVGGFVGGKLTHVLPVVWVRVAFILLMIVVSANMLDLVPLPGAAPVAE